jgi:signal transduction histidine kinase
MARWGEKLARCEEQMKWAVLFAIVLSALTAARDVVSMLRPGQVDDWVWSIASQLTLFLYWAFLTPVVLVAMERIRERGWNRTQALGLHAALYALLGTMFYAFVALVNLYIWPLPGETMQWKYFARAQTFVVVFLNSALKYYVPILLGGTLHEYYRRMREEELKATQLRDQLSQSRFRLLKMQLHPHFLFNALHSISSLIYTDPVRADRMIAQLSDLLRLSLECTDVVMVPLREELEHVRKYLEIERIRFSDRLETKFSIASDTLALDVPNLILQPLVENAIRHGVAMRAGPGTVQIKAYKHRGGLVLAVEDNGPGFIRPDASGIGTRNVRERLAGLYTQCARLSLSNLKPHGARQELFIPIDDISALFEVPTSSQEVPAYE